MRHGRIVQAVAAVALLAVGLAGGVIWGERRGSARSGGAHAPPSAGPGGPSVPSAMSGTAQGGQPPSAPSRDEAVEVTLTPDAVKRADIRTALVQAGTTAPATTVPGTVTSNAYRDTKVNALVSGIVRHVSAELGESVGRGQTLAVIFSNDLADAQMKYLSAKAMLEADHQKRERTRKLVELGAASRQELEEITAVHAAHETEVAATRQRLLLLGLTSDQVAKLAAATDVVSEVRVTAPADGLILTRSVNPGQVIGPGQELFTVTDLRTVWVIGDVYDHDLAQISIGSDAIVTSPASPDRPLRGRVSYVDPRVDPATRTAKVRVEVPNASTALRLGMFVRVGFRSAGKRVTLVPRSAVQAIGERTVVYVALGDGDGRFAERPVKLGALAGDLIEVVAGLQPGEKIVTEGSFFLRAEAMRMRSGG